MQFVLITTPDGKQFGLNARNIMDILPAENQPAPIRCALNIRSWYMDDAGKLIPNTHLVYCQETVAQILAQVNA